MVMRVGRHPGWFEQGPIDHSHHTCSVRDLRVTGRVSIRTGVRVGVGRALQLYVVGVVVMHVGLGLAVHYSYHTCRQKRRMRGRHCAWCEGLPQLYHGPCTYLAPPGPCTVHALAKTVLVPQTRTLAY